MNKRFKLLILAMHLSGATSETPVVDEPVVLQSLSGERFADAPDFSLRSSEVPLQIEETDEQITIPRVKVKKAEFLYKKASRSNMGIKGPYLAPVRASDLSDAMYFCVVYTENSDVLSKLEEDSYYTKEEIIAIIPELSDAKLMVRALVPEGMKQYYAQLHNFDRLLAADLGLHLFDASVLCSTITDEHVYYGGKTRDPSVYSLSAHGSLGDYVIPVPTIKYLVSTEHSTGEWQEKIERCDPQYFINKLPEEARLIKVKFGNSWYELDANSNLKFSVQVFKLINWCINHHYKHEVRSKSPHQIFKEFDLSQMIASTHIQLMEHYTEKFYKDIQALRMFHKAMKQIEEAFGMVL